VHDASTQPHLRGLAPSPTPGPSPGAAGPGVLSEAGTTRGTVAAHHAKGDARASDTIWRANPREQGLLGLTDAIRWFGSQGWSISMPLIDSQPYDLVVDDGQQLHRVQVKTTTRRSPYGIYVVQLETRGGNQSFNTGKPFDPGACDLLYVLTDARTRYLIPTGMITSKTAMSLGRKVSTYRLAADNG
jgi:hypothetical protein